MPSPEDNAKTAKRYLELVAKGRAEDIAELYADDATVEDPVGGEVHIGREAIRRFYQAIPSANNEAEVFTLRAAGNEVACFWAFTVDLGKNRMRIEIITVMTFNEDGKIAAIKAYWTPENVTQL
jgi:steroid Delta-isomerase